MIIIALLRAIECLTIEGPFSPPLFLLHACHLSCLFRSSFFTLFLFGLVHLFAFASNAPAERVVAGLLQTAVPEGNPCGGSTSGAARVEKEIEREKRGNDLNNLALRMQIFESNFWN